MQRAHKQHFKLQCFDIQLLDWRQHLQSPFTMRCHQELFADAQGRHAAMPPFYWRPEGAKTFPLNCPQFVRTISAAS